MILDADTLDAAQTYKILISTIVPRAIGWISTISKEGIPNLAPFSFFTVVGRKPPVLSVTIQHRSDGVTLKDTYVNIHETGEFVANLVTLPLVGGMHRTAVEHPPEIDEFETAGLEKAPSVVVRPFRVALAPVAMECKLEREFTVGDLQDHVVWGRVVRFHLRDDIYNPENSHIDTAALAPVGRLAAEYTLVENIFTTPLEPRVLREREGTRMHRLDGRPSDWSAVNQKNWSPSGSVLEK
ncbi:flavin reductase family protein [Bradyrhizobium sp. RDM4]|uniref:flavin reductase family protein n=1 Tax=Bradyrhizobium sp. RDM4 TaxID=3378765 RepID=UPI0038FCE4B2